MPERTPKPIKAIQTVGFLALVMGVIVRAGTGEYWGTVVGVIGLLVYFLGKFLAWWKNG